MGGAVQHDWEHTVPKVAVAGPRISITYRHGADAPTAVRGRLEDRAHHPSAGAQNRHLAATGSEHRPGRLEARGADDRSTATRGRAEPGRTPLMNAPLSIGTIVGVVMLVLLVTATLAASLLDL